MPEIRPISDLKNYNEVVSCVSESQPVYLTKNGKGAYAIVKMSFVEEFEKLKASVDLLSGIIASEDRADKEGWISQEEMEKIVSSWYEH